MAQFWSEMANFRFLKPKNKLNYSPGLPGERE